MTREQLLTRADSILERLGVETQRVKKRKAMQQTKPKKKKIWLEHPAGRAEEPEIGSA